MKLARQWYRAVKQWGVGDETKITRQGFTRHRRWQRKGRYSPSPVEPPPDYDDDIPWEREQEWCDTCNNLGILNCFCGGDLCVCENGGEYECPDCNY